MASIRTEIDLTTDADAAWDAVRDFGALHTRLVPGFAIDTRLEGDDRLVTFFTGTVLRERLVAVDDEHRRLVWSIVDGPFTHHNGSVEIVAGADGGCRLTWTADLLPDAAAETTRGFMEQGAAIIKRTLDAVPAGNVQDAGGARA